MQAKQKGSISEVEVEVEVEVEALQTPSIIPVSQHPSSWFW